MKYIKKFNEGTKERSIEEWCSYFNIMYYSTINNDNTVDVNGIAVLHKENLEKIPVQFGIVNGSFFCYENKLTSLKGSPSKLGLHFDCHNNKLESLEYCTKEIPGYFNCNINMLTSMEYSPTYVGKDFNCAANKLTSLKGSPEIMNSDFVCSINELISLKYCPKIVHGSFRCENNELTTLIGGPKEVNGSYSCEVNKLITLEGSPENLDGDFYCGGNPIYEVYKLFDHNGGNYKRYKDSLDYNYLRGTNIIKLRFKEALEEINEGLPESIPGYKYI